MDRIKPKTVAVIVAHPDDERLWVGRSILSHPSWNCFIVSLCRGNDTNPFMTRKWQITEEFTDESIGFNEWIKAQDGKPKGNHWQT